VSLQFRFHKDGNTKAVKTSSLTAEQRECAVVLATGVARLCGAPEPERCIPYPIRPCVPFELPAGAVEPGGVPTVRQVRETSCVLEGTTAVTSRRLEVDGQAFSMSTP